MILLTLSNVLPFQFQLDSYAEHLDLSVKKLRGRARRLSSTLRLDNVIRS